jgi:hypothetical protein
MYLFSRSTRLAGGKTAEAMAWAVGITEQVNKVTELGVSLYSSVYSPASGTLVWSAFVPDLATLEAAGDKLQADDKIIKLGDKGASLTTGGLDDNLSQVLGGTVDPALDIEYVSVVQAVCATGKVGRGVEVGIDIAQRVEKITGTPTIFTLNTTGTYGGVGWASGHANVRAMEASEAALMADSTWGEYVDRETAGVYADEPSLTTQVIYRRVV